MSILSQLIEECSRKLLSDIREGKIIEAAVPATLADMIQDSLNICQKIRELELEKDAINEKAKISLKEKDKSIRGLRDICPHLVKYFVSDPSGGNDSYYRCEICGKEI